MPRPPRLEPTVSAQPATVDQILAFLAGRQEGMVARRQLLAAGVSRREIAWRIKVGRLHPVHRGVYAVGHTVVSRSGWWVAAVLAAGPGAVLSHRSAGAAWGVRPDG